MTLTELRKKISQLQDVVDEVQAAANDLVEIEGYEKEVADLRRIADSLSVDQVKMQDEYDQRGE